MNSNYEKIIEKVNSGNLSRKELDNLLKNATTKGGAEDVVLACEKMLASLPQKKTTGGKKASSEIVENRDGYNIMAAAYNPDKSLVTPELVELAEFHTKNNLITDISVLKTQIKLYYKGRHFTSGVRTRKGVFWISCLDETKITDGTVNTWREIGEVVGGKYFSTRYVAVEVNDIEKLNAAFDGVVFT
jgi:hypothetical protein